MADSLSLPDFTIQPYSVIPFLARVSNSKTFYDSNNVVLHFTFTNAKARDEAANEETFRARFASAITFRGLFTDGALVLRLAVEECNYSSLRFTLHDSCEIIISVIR